MFNILGSGVQGSEFLDLFAGTGSVGIEALSRGASHATFIEKNLNALQTIRENLELTQFTQQASVIQADVFEWVSRDSADAYDFAYVAPPQGHKLWSKAVRRLDQNPDRLNQDAWVIAQIGAQEYRALELEVLVEFDRRKYGRTELIFFERPGE